MRIEPLSNIPAKKSSKNILTNNKYKLFIALGFLIWSVAVFVAGIKFHKSGQIGLTFVPLAKALHKNPKDVLNSYLTSVEELDIGISFENYQKLAELRDQALKVDLIDDRFKQDSYKAFVIHKGKKFPAKIRLTGYNIENLTFNKWSLAIMLRDQGRILGMSEFNLHHPLVDGYMEEWMAQKFKKHLGLIAVDSKFVNVKINGESKGIFRMEQRFSKEVYTANARPVGVFIRPERSGHIVNAKQVDSDLTRAKLAKAAQKLVGSVREGRTPPSEAYDYKLAAKYFALVSLFRDWHSFIDDNVILYFNPVIWRLEFIGRELRQLTLNDDAFSMKRIAKYPYYMRQIFSDEEFVREYIRELKIISRKEFLDKFFVGIDEELKYNLSVLHKEHFQADVDKGFYYKSQELIREDLYSKQEIFKVKYLGDEDKKHVFSFCNTSHFPIEVNGPETVLEQKILWPTYIDPLKPQCVQVSVLAESLPLSFSYNVLTMDEPVNFNLEVPQYIAAIKPVSNFSTFDFIEADLEEKEVRFKGGDWKVDRDIIISEGFTVKAGPGVNLNFSQGAKLISHSPLEFKGTSGNPVILYSSDQTGGGVFVTQTGSRSSLEHVVFRNLSSPTDLDWELRGSVTFYEAPVDLSYVKFEENLAGDDSLNIIRSDFSMGSTQFLNSKLDAFDCDFCTGVIVSSSSKNNGDDAFDFSKSRISMKNIVVEGAVDKGISVGEGSAIEGEQIFVSGATIGLANKDGSITHINDFRSHNTKVGIAVFQKKEEFDRPKTEIQHYEYSGGEHKFLLEEEAGLIIDGEAMSANSNNLKEKYY